MFGEDSAWDNRSRRRWTSLALKAVQQWRYRPYSLNEQPVEVETLIRVHFTLAGG